MFRDQQPPSGEPLQAPAHCPECESTRVTTKGKTITESTYWRCEACGEIWNVGRRRPSYPNSRSLERGPRYRIGRMPL